MKKLSKEYKELRAYAKEEMKKPQKGCGKMFYGKDGNSLFCNSRALCPACSLGSEPSKKNHSPQENVKRGKIASAEKPEDKPDDLGTKKVSTLSSGSDFCLSDKIKVSDNGNRLVLVRHLKEFIRRLKEWIYAKKMIYRGKLKYNEIFDEIDKLAGEELSK